MTLKNVKVGDYLIQHTRTPSTLESQRLVKVTSVSPAFVRIHPLGSCAYRIKNGHAIDQPTHTTHCTMPTKEETLALLELQMLRKWRTELLDEITQLPLKHKTLTALTAFLATEKS